MSQPVVGRILVGRIDVGLWPMGIIIKQTNGARDVPTDIVLTGVEVE